MGVNGIFVKQFVSKMIVEKIRPWSYFRAFTVIRVTLSMYIIY
jgi:hypothetical protein